jgi:hypothetical protein
MPHVSAVLCQVSGLGWFVSSPLHASCSVSVCIYFFYFFVFISFPHSFFLLRPFFFLPLFQIDSEMGGACSVHGEDEKCVQNLVGYAEGKKETTRKT